MSEYTKKKYIEVQRSEPKQNKKHMQGKRQTKKREKKGR